MSVPTQGEAFSKLIEYVRKAQEESATLAHLARANNSTTMANGWLAISENLKRMQHTVIQIAQGRLQ